MKPKITLLCCILLHYFPGDSQVPTEQDCLGAILLCDPIYTTSNPAFGQGNYPNETGPGTCQIQGELNSLWLKFSVVSSGDLAFTIYPVSNMDYDWALYNLTNDSCADVLTNGSLLASCNSSQYAITGISSTGVGNWNSFGPTNAFNYLLPVNAGELYYLQINNYYGVTGGFTIDFTPSTAILFNCNFVSFASSQTSICEKFCTDFTDSSINNPTAWQWFFPGGTPSSSTDQNPTNICYDNPGSYDVTLITTTASGNDTLTLPNYITVYPTPPIPTITQNGYTLTSSIAATYQWQFNGVDISGATNQSYTIDQTGYYTVIVSDSNGCINSATIYVEITGVEDLSGDLQFSVYPNPSNGSFVVELFNYSPAENVSLNVANALGQDIFSSEEKISSQQIKKEIDLSATAPGIYFIEIETNDNFVRKKIIIAK